MSEDWEKLQEAMREEKARKQAEWKAYRKNLREENKRIRDELRAKGWDAGVVHLRPWATHCDPSPAATGGLTQAVAERRIVTEAVCHERDHYDKLIGSNLALRRLHEAVMGV